MIYSNPTVYKKGTDVKDILYKSPLDYFDDWKDITSDFSNVGNFRPYRNGSVETISIIYSRKAGLIRFNSGFHSVSTTSLVQNNWNNFFKYDGNEFLKFPINVFFGYPLGNRAATAQIFPGLNSNGNVIDGFGLVQVTGDTNESFFSLKPSINYSSNNFRGIELSGTYWNVIPI